MENGFEPKKPRWADRGEGWTEEIIWCLDESMISFMQFACLPQRINTILFSLVDITSITFFVKISHPMSLWEFALSFSTVNIEFKSKTPCSAHNCKFPVLEIGIFRSELSSLNIFKSDGGIVIPSLTLKDNPFAWPRPWYGSWPIITTLTSFKCVELKALNKSEGFGKIVLFL